MSVFDKATEAVEVIRRHFGGTPRVGIILGTGLSGLASEIEDARSLSYEDIPHMPSSTVISHTGQLVCGTISGVEVIAFEGRFHFYEGWTPEQITFPVRVMQLLGVETLVVSGACGGMNPRYQSGDLVLIDDHINLLGFNPLVGPNDDRLGVRFPDMSAPYDEALIEQAAAIAGEEKVRVHRGVYVAVTGPCLETRAEYRALRGAGADVVGMSTVPEVIVAVHAGLRVLGICVVTDACFPDVLQPAELAKIIQIASEAEPGLTRVLKRVIGNM